METRKDTTAGDTAWLAQVCFNWAIAVALALGFGVAAWLAAQEEPAHESALARQRGAAVSAAAEGFLIRATSRYALEALVKSQGWAVTRRLESINTIGVMAAPDQVSDIAMSWPGVIFVIPDRSPTGA